jgi:hypothetical protein
MRRFWRVFAVWFVVLAGFFALANLEGLVRPKGLLPFRSTGFPWTIAVWGFGVREFFDWSALAVNGLVAFGVSGPVALACAWARCRGSTAVEIKERRAAAQPSDLGERK